MGSVTNIVLTPDFKARVTIHVDSSLAPLHAGTVAQVRVPSLSSVANRYVLLAPGPNSNPALRDGATLPASATKEVVDLDQLFNALNPRTRRGLQQVIQGSAEQYEGAGHEIGESIEYFPPFVGATNHLFSQLMRDQQTFTNFLVETAKAVTTIGAHNEQLSDLIENANTTFTAIGSRQAELAAGLHQLPVTLRQGNSTFAGLPATLSALTTLVKAYVGGHPAADDAVRTPAAAARDGHPRAAGITSRLQPPRSEQRPHRTRTGAPRTRTNAHERLAGERHRAARIGTDHRLLRSLCAGPGGHAADVRGGRGLLRRQRPLWPRLAALPDFRLGEGDTLTPATSPQQAFEALQTGQLRRCPGAATQPAADGSSPFTDGELLSCDPLQTPR